MILPFYNHFVEQGRGLEIGRNPIFTTQRCILPVVNLSKTVYQKGISLPKVAMQAIEARLERNPILPKWDILIRPS